MESSWLSYVLSRCQLQKKFRVPVFFATQRLKHFYYWKPGYIYIFFSSKNSWPVKMPFLIPNSKRWDTLFSELQLLYGEHTCFFPGVGEMVLTKHKYLFFLLLGPNISCNRVQESWDTTRKSKHISISNVFSSFLNKAPRMWWQSMSSTEIDLFCSTRWVTGSN